MNSVASIVALALAAPAMAFQPTGPARQSSVATQMSLRDIASYPDGSKMMSEFEAFDRNGAFSGEQAGFSRSPQGGMGGRPDMQMYQQGGQQGGMGGQGGPDMQMYQQGGQQGGMMGGQGGPDMQMYQQGAGGQGGMGGQGGGMMNPNPFARGGSDRAYTRDGFDPFSAYGESHGMSQSDRRDPRGMGQMRGGSGGGFQGGRPDMMMGGGGGGSGMRRNGVKADNTMGGFNYSSRNREYADGFGAGPNGPMMYGPSPFEYEQGMMGGGGGGFEGGFEGGPMGGMDFEQGYPQQGGEYGGFEGDMSRMAP